MNGKIVVVGLGFGDETALALGTLRLLKEKRKIWLRTAKHPVVKWLEREGIPFSSFDSVYEEFPDFPSVYQEIAGRLLSLASGQEIVYAVPGHPMVAEQTVQLLLGQGKEQGIEIDVRGGSGSFLDAAFARLQIDPVEGFALLDGTGLTAEQLNPRTHVLIAQVYDRLVASDVKLTLMEVYPDEHKVTIANALGVEGMEEIRTLPLYELDRIEAFTDLTSVYVPPVQEEKALYRRFEYLVEVIRHLRSPEGCPWDRKQTHESLRRYLIEEAYEFLEAVSKEDVDAMADELGDVLLQVMLHSQIASEEGTFNVYDVIGRLNDKMIRRHPHVFGEQHAETAEDVKANWEKIKAKEKEGQKEQSIMDRVSKHLPALMMAYEQQKQAAKVGFDWEKKEEVLQKVQEELKEVIHARTPAEQEEELGDLLFVVVNLARFLDVEPELALLNACRKFDRRFRYIEKQAALHKKRLEDLTLEKMDEWWIEAKQREKDGLPLS
jgi:tetrapyrrole methylase family protein / MazG family protein